MKEITCRCGASKKRFKHDIGDFHVAECCEVAGYDHLGRGPKIESKVMEAALQVPIAKGAHPEDKLLSRTVIHDEVTVVVPGPIVEAAQAKPLGRGKLMDLKIADLQKLAQEKGIAGVEGMSKKQLVAALLA